MTDSSSDPGMITQLEATGALRRGHFKLSSGRHSDTYIQCSLLLQHPRAAMEAGAAIAERFRNGVDLVFAPALGALLIGFTTAQALDVPFVFAERTGGQMALRRGFEIKPGTRVLLVEDVITTGGSIMDLAAMVEDAGAEVVGLACIVDRRDTFEMPRQVTSLVRMRVKSFPSDNCPLCDEGVPVTAPGSRYST